MTTGDPIDLSEDGLLAEARQQTGLDDFGDDRFREGLRVLVRTYDTTANLSARGRKSTRRRLVQLLANRLEIEEAFKRHPEIREREIRSPVYLTGLPRTGTSALFNLLDIDPAARALLLWEGTFPDPLDNVAPGDEDPRLVMLRDYYESLRKKNPSFDRIHYVRADGPEECVLLLAHTFCDAQMGIEPLMEPYASWFQSQDLGWSYAYYRDLLKLLDWQRPGERWLLKSPAHLWALDVLVDLFPDACIIQTHRNPLQIIPSYCSMMAALMAIRESFDPKQLGPTVLEYLARSLERAMAARDRLGPDRFLDVDYRRFVSEPMATVEAIYGKFDLELGAATVEAMARHVRENPRAKHGEHSYSLEEYGLTADAVRTRLAGYIARFDVPCEAKN
jgi:hypothetical protein